MTKSGEQRRTQTFKVQLNVGALDCDLDPSLRDAIECFKPLPFTAANDAIAWLRKHIAAPEESLLTVLEVDPASNELLGFFVLRYVGVSFDEQPENLHPAADIGWIARSALTDSGFGVELFEYAVSIGLHVGATAMVVTPHDEETARKVWMEGFNFQPAVNGEQPLDIPSLLWYPLQAPASINGKPHG
jgi:hypothetical protein